MPRTIARDEAVAALEREAPAGCFLCSLACEPPLVAAAHNVVVVPRYAVRWGHLMVLTRAHLTSFADVDRAVWLRGGAPPDRPR